jgi:hypothetical protein
MTGGDGARSLAGRSAHRFAAASNRGRGLRDPYPQGRRGAGRGQSTVEFAIVAPLFFFLFFSVINGGIFLFSRGAIQHAADAGAVQWATQGQAVPVLVGGVETGGADADAFAAMDSNGLKNIVLTTVTEVTLQLMNQSSTTGALTPASNCGGGLCEEVYTPAIGGTWPTTGWNCTTQNWPASARNDGEDGRGGGLGDPPDYAELTIYYSYSTIGSFANFHLTADVVFRLEPQSL